MTDAELIAIVPGDAVTEFPVQCPHCGDGGESMPTHHFWEHVEMGILRCKSCRNRCYIGKDGKWCFYQRDIWEVAREIAEKVVRIR